MERAKLNVFDGEGETVREREVAVWRISSEPGDGIYIALSSSGDLKEDYIGGALGGAGIQISAQQLADLGFHLTGPDEETLLSLGYVKVFPVETE